MEVVVRCRVDAVQRVGEAQQLLTVHALNEFDPKWSGEWRVDMVGWKAMGGSCWRRMRAADSTPSGGVMQLLPRSR